MKFKKGLLVLTYDTNQQILTQVVKLCKTFHSKLFVLFVIESNRISRLASLTHQNIDDLHRKIEEDGWRMLYLVEDEAVENNIWTSLHLEEGDMIKIIKKYSKSYNIDIIFIEKTNENKKIFVSSPTSVMGL